MNLPTKITITRIALIPIIVVCFCLESIYDWMFILTGALYIIASVTDFVDGFIARRYKMVTTLGKFLDPIADKILVVAGLVIGMVSNDYRLNIPFLISICSIIILAREFIISLFRTIAASKNIVLAADKLGKAKTMSTMISLCALMWIPFAGVAGRVFWWIAIVFLCIATVITIVSGINYILKNKQVLSEEKTKEEIIKEEEIEFPDEKCIEALELCFNDKTYSLSYIQKKLNLSYIRAFKICFWMEVRDLVKIENNKKVLSCTLEDINILKSKKEEFDKKNNKE